MKNLLFLLFITVHTAFSQVDDGLYKCMDLILSADKSNFNLDSAGLSQLPDVNYECEKGGDGTNWHVVDLNKDGLNDLIYSGPCQGAFQSAVFLNSGENFNKIHEYPGKLQAIDFSDNETNIYFLKTSCCCDYYSDLITVNLRFDKTVKTKHISYHFNTKLSASKKFKEMEISGVLRYEPMLNDSMSKDPCTDRPRIGNRIRSLTNKKVILLDTKRGWNLVLYREDEGQAFIGWIRMD